MDLYNKFQQARNINRRANNEKIKNALRGTMPKSADLMYDLSRGEKGQKVDNNRRAHLKAVELVSGLLDSFGLPVKPVLSYRGMIKNATDNTGVIEDGIIRLGATIQTLMGHKADIDIPVIIKNKTLIEPAIFLYQDAPYVMCGPALQEIIKRGTLQRQINPRQMYSPPTDQEVDLDNLPRETIVYKEHMFSPGPRNPYNFRRQYSVQAQKDAGGVDLGKAVGPRKEFLNLKNEMDLATTGLCTRCLRERPKQGNMCEKCKEYIEMYGDKYGNKQVKDNTNDPKFNQWLTIDKVAAKEPRKRTNIDTPTIFPNPERGEVPDNCLDPAERSREGLFEPGHLVKVIEDVQARDRGGGHLIIPKGEEGVVVKDKCGDGKMLAIEFPALSITTALPKKFLKSASLQKVAQSGGKEAAVTTDQIQKEVKEMLREGYQAIDIREAINRRYPQHAEEALKGLG